MVESHMDREEFEKLVNEAIATIPKEFLEKIENVAFIVEDFPSPQQMRKLKIRKQYGLLGLYEGVSQIQRQNYTAVMPDKITIFQKPIEMMSSDRESLIKNIQDTVKHEIAHHFGMSDWEIQKSRTKK